MEPSTNLREAGRKDWINVCPNAVWTWYVECTGVSEPWIEKMKEQMNGTYFLVHTYSKLHSFTKAIFQRLNILNILYEIIQWNYSGNINFHSDLCYLYIDHRQNSFAFALILSISPQIHFLIFYYLKHFNYTKQR